MMRRHDLNYITNVANANAQNFNFTAQDGYRTLHIKTLYVGISTAGVSVQLQLNGKFKCLVDCTRFAAGNHPFPVEFDVPNNQTLVVVIKNLAGSQLTNVPVMIGYDVDQDV